MIKLINVPIFACVLAFAVGCSALADSEPLFRSSGCPLQYTNFVDYSTNVGGYIQTATPELSQAGLPGDWGDYWIPTHSGTNVIRFAGAASGGNAVCAMKAYTVLIAVHPSTKLSYWLFPQQENAEYVGVDLHCTDGTLLSRTGAVDQNGASLDPASGHGGIPVRRWSQTESQIGKWLAGKTIDKVLVTYRRNGGQGQYRGYIDDIVVTDAGIVSPSQIVSRHALSAPCWTKHGVIYGISEKQFSGTGDLRGVDAGLHRLHDLGVTVIWLLPVNTIGTLRSIGSPYCVRDFYGIDPSLGSSSDLSAVVNDAHALGMKVILDETLDHTSWDNVLIEKHPEWYRHDDGDLNNPRSISRTPYWGDVAQLDYARTGLRDWMIQMLRWWVKTYYVDGFRFDSAELVPTEFWNQASTSLRSLSPDILLLGEGNRPETELAGINLDYSFTVYAAIGDVLRKKEPASLIRQAWEEQQAIYPRDALHMRYSGNQDTDKAAAAFGGDAAHALAVLTFTLDGVPMVYNGTEIDDTTSGGIIGGSKIDWSTGDRSTERLLRSLALLRMSDAALTSTDLRWIPNDHPDRLLTFVRGAGQNETFVAIDFSASPLPRTSIPMPDAGAWVDVTPTDWNGIGTKPDTFDQKPFGYAIFKRRHD